MNTGTIISKINIPKPSPKTKVITVGFKNCASVDCSNNKGANPKTVVSVVKSIGLNLSHVALIIAPVLSIFFLYSLKVEMSTIESFIIIPVIPINPIILNIDKAIP